MSKYYCGQRSSLQDSTNIRHVPRRIRNSPIFLRERTSSSSAVSFHDIVRKPNPQTCWFLCGMLHVRTIETGCIVGFPAIGYGLLLLSFQHVCCICMENDSMFANRSHTGESSTFPSEGRSTPLCASAVTTLATNGRSRPLGSSGVAI